MAEAIRKAIQMKKSSLMRTGLTLTLTLALIFVGFYVVTSDTLGWFSANKKVNANGIGVIAQNVPMNHNYRYRSDASDVLYDDLVKDDSKTYYYYVSEDGNGSFVVAEVGNRTGKDLYVLNAGTYSLFVDSEQFFPVGDGWEKVFSTVFPGDAVHMKIVYENSDSQAYTANVRLQRVSEKFITEPKEGSDPTDPNPPVDYYYFGSQLCVEYAWTGYFVDWKKIFPLDNKVNPEHELAKACGLIRNEAQFTGTGGDNKWHGTNFLVPNPNRQVAFEAEIQDIGDTVVYTGLDIAAAAENGTPSVTNLYFTIEFEYLPANQNNYKFENFKEKNGECIRRIVSDLTPVEAS